MKKLVENFTMWLVAVVFGSDAKIVKMWSQAGAESAIREDERSQIERIKCETAESARQQTLDLVDQAFGLVGKNMSVDGLAGEVMTLAQESSERLTVLEQNRQEMLDRQRAELEGLMSSIRAQDKLHSEHQAVLEGLKV